MVEQHDSSMTTAQHVTRWRHSSAIEYKKEPEESQFGSEVSDNISNRDFGLQPDLSPYATVEECRLRLVNEQIHSMGNKQERS